MSTTTSPVFSKLKKLIMLDSYKKDTAHEILIDGHTNLNGSNGNGKTSMLLLPNVFMGAKPSRLVVKNRVRKSFVDYYLPRETSYIAFEYERAGQDCMVFMYRATNDSSICYRFVDKGFDLSDFTELNGEGKTVFVSCRRIKDHIESNASTGRKVFCSSQITSLDDYRAIIQNLHIPMAVEYRSLVNRFSFAEPGRNNRLKDIEKIAMGLLSRTPDFDELLDMLVSCITEDQEKLDSNVNLNALTKWYTDYKAYQTAEEVRPAYVQLGSLAEGLDDLKKSFAVSEIRLTKLKNGLVESKESYDSQIELFEKKLEDDRSDYQKVESELQSVITQLMAKLEFNRKTVNELISQKSYYDNNDIEGKRQCRDAVADNERMAKDKESFKKQLLATSHSEQDKIEREFKDRIDSVRNRLQEYLAKRNIELSEIERTYSAARDELHPEFEKKAEAIESRFREIREDFDGKILAVVPRISALEAEIRQVSASQESLDLLESKKVAKSLSDKEMMSLMSEKNDIGKQISEKKQAYHETASAIEKLKRDNDGLSGKIDDLNQVINANQHTLLGFLRENKPDWESSIGKVIKRDLLLSERLNPVVVGDTESLFGISLSLDGVAESHEFNVDHLLKEIGRHKEKIKANDASIQELNEALRKVDEDRQSLEKSARMLEVKSKELSSNAQNLEKEILSQEIVIEQEKEGRRTVIRELLGETIEEKIRLEAGKRKALEEERDEKQSLRKWQENRLIELRKQRDEPSDRISTAMAQQEADAGREIDKLQSDCRKILDEKKVDTKVIDELSEEIRLLDKKIAEGRSYASMVEKYDYWLANEWVKVEPINEAIDVDDKSLKAANDDRETKLQAYEEGRDKIKAALKKGKEEIQRLNSQIAISDRLLGDLSAYPKAVLSEMPSFDDSHTINFLESEVSQGKAEYSKKNTEVKNAINTLSRKFRDRSGSDVYSYFMTCERKFSDNNIPEEDALEFWDSCFGKWFNEDSPNMRSALISEIANQGGAIRNYKEKLEAFEDGVKSFSSNLSKHIDSNIAFDRLSNIQVGLICRIKEIGYWKDIESVSVVFDEWLKNKSDQLPTSVFADMVHDLIVHPKFSGNTEVVFRNLVDFDVKVKDNGVEKVAKNSHELQVISSNGLSFLILSVIYVGIFNMIRKNQKVCIVCPIDELKDLSGSNAAKMMDMFKRNYINIFSAFPDPDVETLSRFDNKYYIDEDRRIKEAVIDQGHQDSLNALFFGE